MKHPEGWEMAVSCASNSVLIYLGMMLVLRRWIAAIVVFVVATVLMAAHELLIESRVRGEKN